MTINFDIDMDDMMSFQRHFVNTSPMLRKTKRMITYIFPVFLFLFGIVGFYTTHSRFDLAFGIFMLIIITIWVIFIPKLFVHMTLKRSKKILLKPGNEIMFGKFEMSFTDEGLDVKTPNTSSNILWNIIPKAEETQNYIYIYLSQVSAYIIPKQKISNSEVEELHTLLNTRLLLK